MRPYKAYKYAFHNHTTSGFDLEYYQDIACKDAYYAYWFAKDIPGANIEYCQKYTCYNLSYALCFAKDIPGADIEYCRKACEHDKDWLNEFDKMIAKKAMI